VNYPPAHAGGTDKRLRIEIWAVIVNPSGNFAFLCPARYYFLTCGYAKYFQRCYLPTNLISK
jgi:hypothetical protein